MKKELIVSKLNDQEAKVETFNSIDFNFGKNDQSKNEVTDSCELEISLRQGSSVTASLKALEKAKEFLKQDKESQIEDEERFKSSVMSVVGTTLQFTENDGIKKMTTKICEARKIDAEYAREERKAGIEFENELRVLRDEYEFDKIRREIKFREELKELGYNWVRGSEVTPIIKTEE